MIDRVPLRVVANLDVPNVTWANGFCRSAEKAGAEIVTPTQMAPDLIDVPVLYIGDAVDWTNVPNPKMTGYFLAAVDGTNLERTNVESAVMTTTPSRAERERAQSMLEGERVFVDGFPIDFTELDDISRDTSRQRDLVGFVGRTDIDKGPEQEIALAAELTKAGFRVTHLSSTPNAIGAELVELGVEVAEKLKRPEYLGRLARLGCVINTSPRESLFVSGIEATRLGVPVVAPFAPGTGIADWNNPKWFYNPGDTADAVGVVIDATINNQDMPDVSYYDAGAYVARVGGRIAQIAGKEVWQ